MNASENRKYMEAIREMVNHKGGFHVKEVLKSHGVPTTCATVLSRLKWTKGQGRAGSFWIHGKPTKEGELLHLAVAMRVKLEEMNRENREKYHLRKSEAVRDLAARVESDGKGAAGVIPGKMEMKMDGLLPQQNMSAVKKMTKRAPQRKEVSLLWGMIKWTR